MLIATLPAIHRRDLMEEIVSHPLVDWVRYNVGVKSAYSPKETLASVLKITEKYDKKLSIDIKGRQLRIVHWAVPEYGKIILNHEIEVDCPAQVFFRGNERSELKVVRGNTIYVDPPPKNAVGEGQAINIHSKNLMIKGYLTINDIEYIQAAADLGIGSFMLSFVEGIEDLDEIEELLLKHPNYRANSAEYIFKIESLKGIDFVIRSSDDFFEKIILMAARDDLMINIGENKSNIITALDVIIRKDPKAIVASRIFSGIESSGYVTMGDLSDIRLMQLMGYKHFMLSDGICGNYFDKVIKEWSNYLDFFRNEFYKNVIRNEE